MYLMLSQIRTFFTASVDKIGQITLFSLVISTSWTFDQDQVFELALQHAVSRKVAFWPPAPFCRRKRASEAGYLFGANVSRKCQLLKPNAEAVGI